MRGTNTLVGYRPDIDGLRAVAVTSVLAFHAFPEIFPGGFIGVDIFFVISGYLISSIIMESYFRGEFGFREFYAKRILRIFPALILVLLTSLVTGWYVLFAEEYKLLGKHVFAGGAFFSNFAFWFESGYFDKASEFKPLLHLWSLGVEEQFYIFWPLLLLFLLRLGRWFHACLALIFCAIITLAIFVSYQDLNQAFYSPLLRSWELLSGVMILVFVKRFEWARRLTENPSVRLVAMLVVLLGVFMLDSGSKFPGFLAFIPVLPAFVLISGGENSTDWISKFLNSRIALAIGVISYPLYLWHWPLLAFPRILSGGEIPVHYRFAILVFTFVLAFATYRFVEVPIKRVPRRHVVVGLVVIMSLISIVGANVYQRNGLERIRHKKIIDVSGDMKSDFEDFERSGLIAEDVCDLPFVFPLHEDQKVCLVQEKTRPYDSVVIGDSHAVHAFWGLSSVFEKAGKNLKVVGRGACVPFLDYSSPDSRFRCQPDVDTVLHSIVENTAVKIVVFAFRGRYLSESASAHDIEKFSSAMQATIELLKKSKKEVYVILPIVEPGFDPRLCAGHLPFGRVAPKSCDIDLIDDNKKSLRIRDAMMRVLTRFGDVRVFDPNEVICSEDKCPIIKNGHSIFKDDNHISYYGSKLIADSFNLIR